jgi:hypothetical protein
LVLGLLVLVAVFVNPFREVASDDDWAYALTVRHLLETGQYRLNNWASANMIAQVSWAALLAQVFGYSLSILRLSTLIVLVIGLIACYCLLRDFGLRDAEASLLTMTIVASPLVVFFAFSFNTDVPFLSWLLIAFWLYARALRRHSYPAMALASVAGAAAIGTRQFGVALVGGLVVTWLMEKERLRTAPLYLAGMAFPLVVGLWQIGFGLSTPTYFMTINLDRQAAFLSNRTGFAAEIFFWRPVALFPYLGLFLLPLLPLGMLQTRHLWMTNRPGSAKDAAGVQRLSWTALTLLLFWCVFIGAGVVAHHRMRGQLMPTLPMYIPLVLAGFPGIGDISQPLTVVTAILGILLGWLVSKRFLTREYWRTRPGPDTFLFFTTIVWFGLQLVYVDYYDEYLLAALPLGVCVLGYSMPVWPQWCRVSTFVLSTVILFASALRTRGELEEAEAFWQAAEKVRLAGVPPDQIAAGKWTWNCYHAAAFEGWVDEVREQKHVHSDDFFARFLVERESRAKYVFAAPDGTDYTVLGRVPYRDTLLNKQYVYIFRQTPVPAQPRPVRGTATGTLDTADGENIYGWAWDPKHPDTSIAVDIYDDESLLTSVPADEFRPDLRAAGIGNGRHAFHYPTPSRLKDGEEHTIRVKASGSNMELAAGRIIIPKSR